MITVHRPESNRFMLIIIGSKKENIIKIINSINANLYKVKFEKNFNNLKATCYGEYLNRIYPIVNVSTIKEDVWAFEYHINRSYIVNNFSYKETTLSDIRYVVDVLYQTGSISFREAIAVLLRKRIFKLDEERISSLLEIENSNLYQSLIDKFLAIYLDPKFRKRINLDMKSLIEREMTIILRTIRNYSIYFKKLQNLNFDKFTNLLIED